MQSAGELHAMHDYRPDKIEEGQNMFGDSFRNYEDSARQAVVVRTLKYHI